MHSRLTGQYVGLMKNVNLTRLAFDPAGYKGSIRKDANIPLFFADYWVVSAISY